MFCHVAVKMTQRIASATAYLSFDDDGPLTLSLFLWHPPFCGVDSTLCGAPTFTSTMDRSVINNFQTREKGRLSNMRSREGVSGVFLTGYTSLTLIFCPRSSYDLIYEDTPKSRWPAVVGYSQFASRNAKDGTLSNMTGSWTASTTKLS